MGKERERGEWERRERGREGECRERKGREIEKEGGRGNRPREGRGIEREGRKGNRERAGGRENGE